MAVVTVWSYVAGVPRRPPVRCGSARRPHPGPFGALSYSLRLQRMVSITVARAALPGQELLAAAVALPVAVAVALAGPGVVRRR